MIRLMASVADLHQRKAVLSVVGLEGVAFSGTRQFQCELSPPARLEGTHRPEMPELIDCKEVVFLTTTRDHTQVDPLSEVLGAQAGRVTTPPPSPALLLSSKPLVRVPFR